MLKYYIELLFFTYSIGEVIILDLMGIDRRLLAGGRSLALYYFFIWPYTIFYNWARETLP